MRKVGLYTAGIGFAILVVTYLLSLMQDADHDPISVPRKGVADSGIEVNLESVSAELSGAVLPDTAADKSELGEVNAYRGVFGQEVIDPWSTYLRFIGYAEDGDPESQFEISRILFECKGLPTRERIDAYIDDGIVDANIGAEMHDNFDLCAELIANVPGNLSKLSREWLDKSVENQFPSALARDAIFSPGKYTVDEARDIIMSVIQQKTVESYSAVAFYYANYREEDTVNYEAWLAVACSRIPGCLPSEYRGAELPPLQPHTQVLVDDAVARINDALENQNWPELEL